MAVKIVTALQKRFADIDMFGHVNNAAQQQYFDLGKLYYFRNVLELNNGRDDLRLVMASTTNNYYRQITMADEVEVHTSVARIGTKSIHLFQQIVGTDGSVYSNSATVMVAFDFASQTTVEVPAEWRTRIESCDSAQ